MIDFHNHVIPNVDDGAKNLGVALEMCQKAIKDDTTCIINTCHYQHPTVKSANHKEYVKNKKKLSELLIDHKINLEIILGAEVYYDINLAEIIENPFTTIGDKYMLVEFNPNILPITVDEIFFKLKLKGIYPIIAHPERYRFVQKDISIVKKWIDKDYFIQLNAGSIMGFYGKMMQKTAFSLLKNEYCHLLGSDAHDNQNRSFCLKDSLAKIKSKYGQECAEIINDNSIKLLNGEDLIPVKSSTKKKKLFFLRKL